MPTIALDRRFFEWRDEQLSDPELILRWGRSGDLLPWDGVLSRRRVVLLAEAGSGKTEEMREQARLRTAGGEFAAYMTVEDVARDGVEGALNVSARERLAAWRATDADGWFFIDSVDEARLGRVRLERALRRIADGILGVERRAFVVLSCRLTDWQTSRDLQQFKEALPIPRNPGLLPPPAPEELLVDVLHTGRRTAPASAPEAPLVVLMAPLDDSRVRLFAAAKGVPDLDAFVKQIQDGNLWQFARRPLDLDWLVDFWRAHGSLGSLAEMLETSLAARLVETNPDRAREDALDATRALHALERIGGALVTGRKETIAIPDSDLLRAEDDRPLDVVQVLPDWAPQDCARLLTRPVFDPATYGRARLHNDNQGVVRAYLMARWLNRIRNGNLSRGELFGILFATSYGLEVIKPSMQETAAWLALWDDDVGREVARRMPVLLLTAGDPASLPATVREAALADVLALLAGGAYRLPMLDPDSLKRFARSDLGRAIQDLWPRYQNNLEACRLMLRLIWLGGLRDCADLAAAIAFDPATETYAQATAGRAVIAAGEDALKARYAAYVRENCAALPHMVVTDAIDGLFPGVITVPDLLEILGQIDVGAGGTGSTVEWQAPGWIERLEARADLEQLLRGLLDQLGPEPREIGHIPDKREEAYFSAMAVAAARLLERCQPDEAPTDTIDATQRIGLGHRFGHHSLRETSDPGVALNRTPARRRRAFWRLAEQRNGHPWLGERPIEHVGQIGLFGYLPTLERDDLDWLLSDAPARAEAHERRLAINTALMLWRDAGSPPDVLAQIEAVVRTDAVMAETVANWVSPPDPPPERQAQERELAELKERNRVAREERDRSWVEFVAGLRADPDQLRGLPAPTAEGVDTRLYHLWLLLSEAVDASTRYAIDTVAPLEPMLGTEVAAALRDGLIRFWRQWRPKQKRERTADERNRILGLDCMGIAGISLEAAGNKRWAEQLSADEARLAAVYGTLEINGFPVWYEALARERPAEVGEVLTAETAAEIDDPEPRDRCEVLDDITRAGRIIAELMAPVLYAKLRQSPEIPWGALSPMLRVIVERLREDREAFAALAIDRFQRAETEAAALYMGAAFGVNSDAAAAALAARLEQLEPQAQTELVQAVLPDLFGTGFGRLAASPVPLAFATLERLVRIAFRTIRYEEDRNRPSGEAFSPDARDNAEHARGAAFQQLIDTPGRATFTALERLAADPEFPINKEVLRERAIERAHLDAESAPWLPGEVAAFEAAAESAPSTGKDLQRTALRRLDDIQHDLLHGDFAQGATLQGLVGEAAVQNWVAGRLRQNQGRAYSVEREPHVVDEKEPDIRLRARASDASLAIEVKIAESWTLLQLEAALVEQLCGRYLQARDGRHGVLLLVHQHARAQGWQDPTTGAFLTFGAVVERLRGLAVEIAGADPDAPQPELAVLDVSTCGAAAPTPRRRAQRK